MPKRVIINDIVDTVMDNRSNTEFSIVCISKEGLSNRSPVIDSPLFVNVTQDTVYNFDPNLILDSMSDIEGNSPWVVRIEEVPLIGDLMIGTKKVLNKTTIPWGVFEQLVWKPREGQYGLNYSRMVLSIRDDGGTLRCYSNKVEIIFNVIPENQQPTVADNDVEILWNSELILYPSYFTLNYYDPEGHNLGYIVLYSLPPPREGEIRLSGVRMNNGDLPITVTSSQLISGDLVYKDPGHIRKGKSIGINFKVFDDYE